MPSNLYKQITLKPGREKSILRKHPWIYSGAVKNVDGQPAQGEIVSIISSNGDFLAWADYSPFSQIRCRIWSWDENILVDQNLVIRRITDAVNRRKNYLHSIDGMDTNAYRIVHAESDGLPGIILDLYDRVVVAQFLSSGAEKLKYDVVQAVAKATGVKHVYERSDADVRRLEGLPSCVGWLFGGETGEDVEINENGLRFRVDILNGHKTGFYLDQRINRYILKQYVEGRDILDCFCYTGGFTCASAMGGAKSILAVESSENSLQLAEENYIKNEFDRKKVAFQEGNVFKLLREFRDQNKNFDLIILDPPKFASTTAQVTKASRGYKDINILGLKLLRPGGFLFTFSCSGGVDSLLFQKIVAGAALDANVNAQIVQQLHQAPDHPVSTNFPEGIYLKGLVIQVI